MEDRGTDTTCSLFLFTAINTFFSGLGKKKKKACVSEIIHFFLFYFIFYCLPFSCFKEKYPVCVIPVVSKSMKGAQGWNCDWSFLVLFAGHLFYLLADTEQYLILHSTPLKSVGLLSQYAI